MSRIIKTLPAARADYSFGDLVYWHLFVYGTRPSGDPAAAAGREWDAPSFCRKLNITDRTLRNWIAHRSLPDRASEIAITLFGDNPLFDAWRAELSEALRAARLEKSRKSRSGFRSDTDERADDPVHADATDQLRPSGDARRDEPLGTGPERNSPDEGRRAQSTALVPYEPSRHDGERRQRWLGAIHLVWSNGLGGDRSRTWSQRSASALVSSLVILIGLYAWVRSSPESPTSAPPSSNPSPSVASTEPSPRSEPSRQTAEVAPSPEAKPQAETPKPEPPKADPSLRPPAEAPKAEAPKAEPQPVPTDPKQAEAVARQQAFDAEQRARDEAARRGDADPEAAAARDAQGRREADARQLAGAGFRLIENNSAFGASIGHVFVETVTECAEACRKSDCDAFTFPANPRAGKNNTCHRYKAPISLYPESSARSGKRIADALPSPKLAEADAAPGDAPSVLAQANPAPAATEKQDDLTRCANGVFKVSGFKLSCDRIMDGGTSLGSNALRYVVANINQCAAKCRPIARCVGFTFNAADPEGQHTCQIFGPVPVTREVGGWVTGTR